MTVSCERSILARERTMLSSVVDPLVCIAGWLVKNLQLQLFLKKLPDACMLTECVNSVDESVSLTFENSNYESRTLSMFKLCEAEGK